MLNFILIFTACLAALFIVQIGVINPLQRKKICKTIQSIADNLKLEIYHSPGLLSKVLPSSPSYYPVIKGKMAGYELKLEFCRAKKNTSYQYIAANLRLTLPEQEQLPLTILSKISHPSDHATPIFCERFDYNFIVSSTKGEAYSLALLNDEIRDLLFNYINVDDLNLGKGELYISSGTFEAGFLTNMAEDMVKLLDHLTGAIDIKKQLVNSMLNDSSEGFSLKSMLALKDMNALEEQHLEALCEHPNAEIAALAAGELGKSRLPLLLEIFQLDESGFCQYMSDEELAFDEIGDAEEVEYYYHSSPPLLALNYLKKFLDEEGVREGLYKSFTDEELCHKINRGHKYTLLLELFIEEKDSASVPYILNTLEELSEHLVKGAPFKAALIRYLGELDVKESNEWLQIELDKGSSEEQLAIIKTLGLFGHSSSRELLEQYGKNPLASKEIKEAAQQALKELY